MAYINKIISLLILMHTQNLGRTKIKRLIDDFGSPEKVVEAGWDEKNQLLFRKWKVLDWEDDLKRVEEEGVYLVSYLDSKYPKNLLSIPDFPLLLYIKGTLLENDADSIAIVGTRNATLYGKQMAEKLAKEMGMNGVCVVSGLARGIDTAAHEGAMKGGGRTLAVMGCGLSHIYPKENCYLADKITHAGAILSEYPMNKSPAKGLFPQRNRIISGISKGICLIESPLKGGGMITMQLGKEQNKALFALPGRVDWATFEGNHLLIKQREAELVENSQDLSKFFKIAQNQEFKKVNISNLTPEEIDFLTKMPKEEKTIEELVLLTQLPIMQLNVLLTRLVLKKFMKEFPGKTYKKVEV